MADVGVLFSEPMVQALLCDTKTQTRRAVRPWVTDNINPVFFDGMWLWASRESRRRCRYGNTGDTIWVRETWQADPPIDGSWASTQWAGVKNAALSEIPERFRNPTHCLYRATWLHGDIRWRPAIHMPRWAARIRLFVEKIEVQRLQDITGEDAIAEGIACVGGTQLRADRRWRLYGSDGDTFDPIASYRSLWEEINPGTWDLNPWVWVIHFRRITT